MSHHEAESLSETVDRATRGFADRYGRPARWIVAAPGRVNLIGEHIDYNDGCVLPMAIDRYTVIAADRPTPNQSDRRSFLILSEEISGLVELEIGSDRAASTPDDVPRSGWSRYLEGVLEVLQGEGLEAGPLDILIASDVPVGSGLSSSAALEVATATLVEAVHNRPLELSTKALLCQRAEHEYAGVPCGIMDQFSSVHGRTDHLMRIDCRSLDVVHVPFDDPALTVLIVNTRVSHELGAGEYADRRERCERAAEQLGVRSLRDVPIIDLEEALFRVDDDVQTCLRHVVTEIDRTARAVEAIERRDWLAFGNLMYESHRSLRDDYRVSCRELDLCVEAARAIGEDGGVLGSRMTGGGFGGCAIALIRTEQADAIAQQIRDAYRDQTGIDPILFRSRPAQGAQIIQTL